MGVKGSAIPVRLWERGVLKLPVKLVEAHERFLHANSWRDEYSPKNSGIIGGDNPHQAKEHVINRFFNSAARMQYVCADPLDEQPEIRAMLLDQMADGHIDLLDIAAGNGSGTLTILALLCELRNEGIAPKLPLNVQIRGVDYSPEALNFYSSLLGEISDWLGSEGINVRLEHSCCDLTIPGETSEVLDIFFDSAKTRGVKRFLWVISALSGIKNEGMERMRDSLMQAAARLSSKKINSSLIWVEPPPKNDGWLNRAFETVQLTLRKIPHVFSKKKDTFEIIGEKYEASSAVCRKFSWLEPYLGKPTESRVVVSAFRKD